MALLQNISVEDTNFFIKTPESEFGLRFEVPGDIASDIIITLPNESTAFGAAGTGTVAAHDITVGTSNVSITSGDNDTINIGSPGAGALSLVSGGEIDLTTSNAIDINAGTTITLDSGTTTNITSTEGMTLTSGGLLTIDTDGATDNIDIGIQAVAKTITIGNDASAKVDINAKAIEIDTTLATGTDYKGTRMEGAYNFAISNSTTGILGQAVNKFRTADLTSAYFVLHLLADNGGAAPFSFFIRGLAKNNGTDTTLVGDNSRETRGTIPPGASVAVTAADGNKNIVVTCIGPTDADEITWRGVITFYTSVGAIYRIA